MMNSNTYEAELQVAQLRTITAEVMTIAAVDTQRIGRNEVSRFRGRLTLESQAAYAQIAPRFRAAGYTPLLRQEADGVALLAMPGVIEPSASRLWLALLLFALTVASTVFIGGAMGASIAGGFSLPIGLAFSAALLSILLAHEMGHYLVARRFGVAVSYPFFIPMPFLLLGTMGAFISMKEPPPDRRVLLAIAVAGPIAGFVVTIPVLIVGLLLSEVQTITPGLGSFTEGNSLVYAAAKIAVFGRFLPSGGQDVFLHPVAFAGWAGLLVTGLNLLPAGQLDGGHIFYALFGPRAAQIVTYIVAVSLLAMGFVWNGWFIWAILVALLGQQRAPILNEVTPLSGGWRWLAVLGLVLFILVFTPIPISILS